MKKIALGGVGGAVTEAPVPAMGASHPAGGSSGPSQALRGDHGPGQCWTRDLVPEILYQEHPLNDPRTPDPQKP